jgi:ParB-like chromosome segregation protein Spo0J
MPIEALKPAEYNPRTISQKAKEGLAASIETFGLVEPIIWNERTGNIVGGHQRYNQLVEHGATETDVVVVSLSHSHERALNITLNNSNIQGDWIDTQRDQMIDDLKHDSLDLVDSLQLADLQVPEWAPFEDVAPPKEDQMVDKIVIRVIDTSLTSEIRDQVQRFLASHWDAGQVSC